MQKEVHTRWIGIDNERSLKALRKHCKRLHKPMSHYMIEATKKQMIADGIIK